MKRDTPAGVRYTPAVVLLLTVACGDPPRSANGDVSAAPSSTETLGAQNPLIDAAERAIATGHPWQATMLLAPALADPKRRTDTLVFVAARAAAGWEGWTEVDRLLAKEAWVDTKFDGEARALLARSALEQNAVDRAVPAAESALRAATSAEQRGARSVVLARALDRAQRDDSAARVYAAGAAALPVVGDWLRLRAAGVTRDADERRRAYAAVAGSVARLRVDWTEAQARERFGDLAGAAELYGKLGSPVDALRVRLAGRDSADRVAAVRQAIVFLRERAATSAGRDVIALLEATPVPLSDADELEFARAVATAAPARSVRGFERVRSRVALSADDRIQYALALSRAGRATDAIAVLDGVTEPPRAAAAAAYQRARLVPGTSVALRQVVTRFPNDTATASSALYLLADLTADNSGDVAAQRVFRELYTKFPTSSRADDARFASAIIDVAAGRSRAAAVGFDSLAALYPTSSEALASRYWAGRAWSALRDTAQARARWRGVIEAEPLSYYAMRAARRLGQTIWTAPPAAANAPAGVDTSGTIARVRMLRRLGLDAEVRLELDALDSVAVRTPASAPGVGQTLFALNEPSRALRIGTRLLPSNARERAVLELAFPLVARAALDSAAQARRLEPALIAGLIRQESAFNPRAVSVVGARGLMQLMPTVGQAVAKSLAFPTYTHGLLFDADANVRLGIAHLAGGMAQNGDTVRALAAYNAGQSRVVRWARKAGVADPELFTERIPFVETRDYVRIVLRNRDVYRALYGLK
jgi:soluble lytic murein transglycosylase